MVVASIYGRGLVGLEDEARSVRELWKRPDGITLAAVGPKHFYMILKGQRLAAVEKQSGKDAWVSDFGSHFKFVGARPNDINNEKDPMRLYVVTRDNVLIVFKEPEEDAGPWSKGNVSAARGDDPEGVPAP